MDATTWPAGGEPWNVWERRMDPGENGHLSLPNKGKELGLYVVR